MEAWNELVKLEKRLNKFIPVESLTFEQAASELWEHQNTLETLGEEFADSFEGVVLCARQRQLDEHFNIL